MSKISEAREKYKPDNIKILFVAEAPPKESSSRFFYYEVVNKSDNLFIETIKVLYPNDFTTTKMVRLQKKKFLDKFKNDGYYLIDSTDTPMENNSRYYKKRKIKESLLCLKEKIRKFINDETKIIIISSPVYDICFNPLRSEGFNVINTEMIDFPSFNHQKNFRNKLSKLLTINS